MIFHSYVSLPEGNQLTISRFLGFLKLAQFPRKSQQVSRFVSRLPRSSAEIDARGARKVHNCSISILIHIYIYIYIIYIYIYIIIYIYFDKCIKSGVLFDRFPLSHGWQHLEKIISFLRHFSKAFEGFHLSAGRPSVPSIPRRPTSSPTSPWWGQRRRCMVRHRLAVRMDFC